MHRLREELHELMRSDPRILDFLDGGSMDGLWLRDLDRPEEAWMSPSFWRLLGRDPARMPHRAEVWADLVHPEDREAALEGLAAQAADPARPFDRPLRYRHADGRWITVRCRGLAIRDEDGRAVRILGAHSDMTALEASERDLRARAAELEAARDAALAAARAETAFLATMSHELRTPMNGILGMAEALARTALDPAQARMLGVMRAAGRDLMSLLDDILHISRLDAGAAELPRAAHDPRASAAQVAALFAEPARARGLAIEMAFGDALPPRILCAERAVRQVLSNLVSNAIKFTAGGRILIELSLEEGPSGPELVARVIDTGQGVPPALREVIFERFRLGDPADRVSGAGLGLAIVARLCALHGGGAGVADTPGGGATFTARFAVGLPDEGEEAEAPAPARPTRSAPLRLLIAEDEAMNREVIAAMLEGSGARLSFAEDGQEALAAMAEGGLDAALIDIRMPVMDGAACARARRAEEAARGLPPLPLIACSADAMAHQIERHLAEGFDRHLSKPLRMEALEEVLAWIAERASGREGPRAA